MAFSGAAEEPQRQRRRRRVATATATAAAVPDASPGTPQPRRGKRPRAAGQGDADDAPELGECVSVLKNMHSQVRPFSEGQASQFGVLRCTRLCCTVCYVLTVETVLWCGKLFLSSQEQV